MCPILNNASVRQYSISIVMALAAVALFVTAWHTARLVGNASEHIVRGQATALHSALIRPVRRRIQEPELLAEAIEELTKDGLKTVVVVKANGTGESFLGEASFPEELEHDEPWRKESIVYVKRRLRQGRRNGRSRPSLVIGFLAQDADLIASARRTRVIGLTVSLLLLFGSFIVAALLRRRDALRRKLQQSERLAALGEMSAVLAHEIRNPIASLKGNAQMLLRNASPGKQQTRTQHVVDGAIRLENVTESLLDFVRTGKLKIQSVNPTEIASNIAQRYENVTVVGENQTWDLDPIKFERALENMVQNGVEAGGPVTITIGYAANSLKIDVQDHGPGLPADAKDVFEPFVTKKTKGTGLGLAVVKRFIELHGGVVSAENTDKGALFTISIPRR